MNKYGLFGIGKLINFAVDQIVANCHCIFYTAYLMDNFPVLSIALAHEVFDDIPQVAETSKITMD